ncbi:hypothetical protein [Pseudomonas sp. Leaf58]|nr:hypothetical protein [Pseudomonas sp. Leaf58]
MIAQLFCNEAISGQVHGAGETVPIKSGAARAALDLIGAEDIEANW